MSTLAATVPIFNVKPLHVLWALFQRGPLEMEIDPESGHAVARWEGGSFGGGCGQVVFPAPLLKRGELGRAARGEIPLPEFEDDPGSLMWLTLLKCREDETMYGRAFALMTGAFALHGQEGAFCLERAVELLHGARDQLRSHRERQTPPFAELERLFSRAHFRLDGSQKPKPAKGRDTSQNTAVISGPLLRVERCGRYSTVRLNEGLYRLLMTNGAAFSVVSAEILRLDVKGHHNRHGNRPSRARRLRHRLAAVFYARARENRAAKDGSLQKVRASDFYQRWTGMDPGALQTSGRMQAYLDTLQEDLVHVATCGGPVLIAIERHRQAGLSWVTFRLSDAARHGVASRRSKYSRPHRSTTRPPVEATRSGRAGSRGP